jgi:hypothetical protein
MGAQGDDLGNRKAGRTRRCGQLATQRSAAPPPVISSP